MPLIFINLIVNFHYICIINRKKMEELDKISFTFHSTTIEGSTLTYHEVYLLLTDNIAAPKPLEHNQMNKETRKKSDVIVFRDYIYQNYINQLTTELEKQKNIARKKGMYLGF